VIASRLDEVVATFRSRHLRAPYPYLWLDALEVECRDDHAHVTPVACLVGVAVNPDGRREVLGVDIITAEDGAGWLSFLRGLVARDLAGVRFVISDAHPGLADVAAAGAISSRFKTPAGRRTRPATAELRAGHFRVEVLSPTEERLPVRARPVDVSLAPRSMRR